MKNYLLLAVLSTLISPFAMANDLKETQAECTAKKRVLPHKSGTSQTLEAIELKKEGGDSSISFYVGKVDNVVLNVITSIHTSSILIEPSSNDAKEAIAFVTESELGSKKASAKLRVNTPEALVSYIVECK